jgi:P-type Cu2+ transporter
MLPKPASSGACRHCGTLTEGDAYCCSGCAAAAELLAATGLEDWYNRRQQAAPRPEAPTSSWRAIPQEPLPHGRQRARFQVQGLRCASCVWVAERLLESIPSVEAQVSYATGRATVSFDPERATLQEACERLEMVGYRPSPVVGEAAPDRDLLLRLGVAAFCTANLMTLAAAVYVGWWDGMDPMWANLFRWGVLILCTPVALWSAQPFLLGAVRGMAAGVLHMDVPIAMAVVVLYGQGVWATVHHQDAYLDSLAMLVTLLLVGRLLEARGRRHVQRAIHSIRAELPATARRITPNGVEEVAATALQVGDVVLVGTGTEIPADGQVTEGVSRVQMALLTGESAPSDVHPGAKVVAGAVVEGPSLQMEVTATGGDTLAGQMASLLEDSLGRERRAEPIAPWFTAFTLAAAGVTLAWWWPDSPTFAMECAIAVLVIACPCAVALSRPLIAAAGLAATARHGLLFRSPDALLDFADADVVAFDKTGTLTGGTPSVVEATDEALRLASALEAGSAHPIAKAILGEAAHRQIPMPRASDVIETAGLGVTGRVDGTLWTVGSGTQAGVVVVQSDGLAHPIRLLDTLRADAVAVVSRLRTLGLDVVALSGDRDVVAARIGDEVGVDVQAEMTPMDKAAWIEKHPGRVAFVGDGLNDAPALAAAQVGIAMATGAAAAIQTADGVLSGRQLHPLVAGTRIARAARKSLRRSLGRSIAYNVVGVGLAMGGWVNPLIAAVAMPVSSLWVIWDASRIGRSS